MKDIQACPEMPTEIRFAQRLQSKIHDDHQEEETQCGNPCQRGLDNGGTRDWRRGSNVRSAHDGEVTLGEAVSYLNQKVVWASKTQYGQEQRPAVVPPLKATDPANGLPLTKLAAVRASEHP